MQHYFSASTGGFYSDVIHGARKIALTQTREEIIAGKRPAMVENPDCKIPADAVTITESQWQELMTAQASGMAIQTNGKTPVAVEPSIDEAARVEGRRRQRDRLLSESDWTQLPDSPLDAITRKAWADYRQALRDLDMTGTDWPSRPDEGAA